MGKSRLNILFLTRPYQSYEASNYQSDIVNGFKRIESNVYVYPFGYGKEESVNDSNFHISQIKNKCKKADILVIGHNWLGDHASENIYPIAGDFLADLDVYKVAFINKEYVRLEDKIKYFRGVGVNKLITHCSILQSMIDVDGFDDVYFSPFGYDDKKIVDASKSIDLFFSGIIVNPFHYCPDQSVRSKVEDKLFYKAFKVRLKGKSDYEIFWNAVYPKGNLIVNVLNKYRRLPTIKYYEMISQSKAVFCTPSFNLITPRYFEAMGAGAIPLAFESDLYDDVTDLREHIYTFSEPEEFPECIEQALIKNSNPNEMMKFAKSKHSWDTRIDDIVDNVLFR